MKTKTGCYVLSALLMLMALTLPFANAYAAEEAVSRTTGLPVSADAAFRPVIVQMHGASDGATHYNLASADIVYEGIYWAPGWTSLMALYNDELPDKVGGVRGARPYNAEIAAGWHGGYIFWGAAPSGDETELYKAFEAAGYTETLLGDMTRSDGVPTGAAFRQEDIDSPGNAMVNVALWAEEKWPDGHEAQDPGWLFSNDSPSRGEKTAGSVAFYFGEEKCRIVFDYNEEMRMYERSVGGMWDLDSETTERIRCSNLIVQAHPMAMGDRAPAIQPQDNLNPMTLMETTGEGPMRAYIGGTCIEGTWSREAASDPIVYRDAEGEPLVLLPGKTFIELLPEEMFATEAPMWGHDVGYSNAGSTLQ